MNSGESFSKAIPTMQNPGLDRNGLLSKTKCLASTIPPFPASAGKIKSKGIQLETHSKQFPAIRILGWVGECLSSKRIPSHPGFPCFQLQWGRVQRRRFHFAMPCTTRGRTTRRPRTTAATPRRTTRTRAPTRTRTPPPTTAARTAARTAGGAAAATTGERIRVTSAGANARRRVPLSAATGERRFFTEVPSPCRVPGLSVRALWACSLKPHRSRLRSEGRRGDADSQGGKTFLEDSRRQYSKRIS